MREILFRGAQKVDGSKSLYWYEGSLVIEKDTYTDDVVYYIQNENGSYLVIHETVGQYTGLNDKNGNKIFDGDILKRKLKFFMSFYHPRMKVVFVPVKAYFAAVDIDGSKVTFISDYINNKYELEKIGNIHDNPELVGNSE